RQKQQSPQIAEDVLATVILFQQDNVPAGRVVVQREPWPAIVSVAHNHSALPIRTWKHEIRVTTGRQWHNIDPWTLPLALITVLRRPVNVASLMQSAWRRRAKRPPSLPQHLCRRFRPSGLSERKHVVLRSVFSWCLRVTDPGENAAVVIDKVHF